MAAVILKDKIRTEGPNVMIIPLLCENPTQADDWQVKRALSEYVSKVLPGGGLSSKEVGRPRNPEDASKEKFPQEQYPFYAEWKVLKGI